MWKGVNWEQASHLLDYSTCNHAAWYLTRKLHLYFYAAPWLHVTLIVSGLSGFRWKIMLLVQRWWVYARRLEWVKEESSPRGYLQQCSSSGESPSYQTGKGVGEREMILCGQLWSWYCWSDCLVLSLIWWGRYWLCVGLGHSTGHPKVAVDSVFERKHSIESCACCLLV